MSFLPSPLDHVAKSAVSFIVALVVLAASNGLIAIDAPLWLDLPLIGLGVLGYVLAVVALIVGADHAHDAYMAVRAALKGE